MPQPPHKLLAIVVCLFLIASCASSDRLASSSEGLLSAPSDTEAVAVADPTATATAEPTPEPELTSDSSPVAEPSATPTPTVAPTSTPAPTAVPPTPVWVQQASGPTASPYTYVVLSVGDAAEFVDGPEGSEIDAPADADLVGASVLSGGPEDDVVEVALGGGTAWVRTDGLDFGWSSRILEIDVTRNLLRVFEGNELLVEVAAATGASDTPTSPLSGHARIETFEGSLPKLGIVTHADEGASVEFVVSEDELGGYTTDGDVEIARSTAFLLAALLQSGARVEIVGAPAPPPTPAPLPTPARPRATAVPVAAPQPTPIPEDCPGTSLGTPGDCYYLVNGQEIYGSCESDSAVTFGESCWIFAGDKQLQVDGRQRCPEFAEYEKDGRCYAPAGFREVVDILCPPNATAVDLECRIPVE